MDAGSAFITATWLFWRGWEGMTSDRSYRSSIGTDAARAELRRGAGTQFDADAAAALLRVLERESELARAA